MTEQENYYMLTGKNLVNAVQSQMFGKPCFKVNGKAFMCFFQEEIAFKLQGESHRKAINLKGSKLFDPSGKQRPMKEWVQVPFTHKELWAGFAEEAMKYVSELK